MIELTYEQVQKYGMDTFTIEVCKKLRRLGKLDRVALDKNKQPSKKVIPLLDYIEYCGADILIFMKQYLTNLQPYMILSNDKQGIDGTILCKIDDIYPITVRLEVPEEPYEVAVISFEEKSRDSLVEKTSSLNVNQSKYVPVFADVILDEMYGDRVGSVKVFCPIGLMVLPFELQALKWQDIFIVEKNAIKLQCSSYCSDYIRDLYTSDLPLNFERVEVLLMLSQMGQTSYGKDTVSSIALLIDCLCAQTHWVCKSVADFAMVVFVRNLILTDWQKREIISQLEQEYMELGIPEIRLILQRIKDNLALEGNWAKR